MVLYHKLTHSSTYDLLPPHSHNSLPSYCITNSLILAHTTFSHHTHTILYQVIVSQTHSFKHIRPSPTTLTQFFTKLLYHKLTHSSTYDLLPPHSHNSLPSYCITNSLIQAHTTFSHHTHTILYQVIVSQTHSFKHIRPSPTTLTQFLTKLLYHKLTHSSTYDLLPPHSHNSLPSYCITNSLIQAHTTFSHHTHTILYQVIVSQTHSF